MRASLVAAAVLLCSTLFARADTINAFYFRSDLTGGYVAQGIINIDVTDGQTLTSFFTLSQGGVIDSTFTSPDYSDPYSTAYVGQFVGTNGYEYEILLPTSTLVGYTGGNVCTATATCAGYPSGVYLAGGGDAPAIDGSLSPTPEPASVIMLATGLAAGYVVWRRRWV